MPNHQWTPPNQGWSSCPRCGWTRKFHRVLPGVVQYQHPTRGCVEIEPECSGGVDRG